MAIKIKKETYEFRIWVLKKQFLEVPYIKKFDNLLPNIIGVQIIQDEVILMPPLLARMDFRGTHGSPILIRSQELANMYIKYYDKLWNEIDKCPENQGNFSHDEYKGYRGYILYDGKPNESLNNNIWEQIKFNIEENKETNLNDKKNEELTDKDLRKKMGSKGKEIYESPTLINKIHNALNNIRHGNKK